MLLFGFLLTQVLDPVHMGFPFPQFFQSQCKISLAVTYIQGKIFLWTGINRIPWSLGQKSCVIKLCTLGSIHNRNILMALSFFPHSQDLCMSQGCFLPVWFINGKFESKFPFILRFYFLWQGLLSFQPEEDGSGPTTVELIPWRLLVKAKLVLTSTSQNRIYIVCNIIYVYNFRGSF